MSRRSRGQSTSGESHELQVAAATAREAVLQLHTEHARELLRLGAGRVSPLRMLEIYVRLLELTDDTAEAVTTRVLASLGRAPVDGAAAISRVLPTNTAVGDDVIGHDDSLLRVLRRRLRGRIHDDLRRAVEIRVGVTRTALLHLHVTHAHRFVRLLADSHELSAGCAVYARMVKVPSAHKAVLYMLVLDRIAAEDARVAWPATAKPPAQPPVKPPAEPRRLRRQALGER